jgi:NADP-dependent 3-hydroxy acid dehydrogenase YdfG
MARSPRPLEGRVVAITGGARGIGRATAQACVRAGMRVAIGDLDLAAAQQTAGELGNGTIALALNVVDRASMRDFLDAAEAQLGPLDVLVNNAGIMPLSPFTDESDATAHRLVDINVHGVLHGMKEALPRMRAGGRGHLVNIASTAGKVGFAGGATYSGTKHFVVGVSEGVRAELRGTAIEVTCVMPGVVNTELATGLKEARGVKNVQPQDVAEAIVDALQVPRFDVFVPKSIGPILSVMGLVPRRGREAMTRLVKADQVLASADPNARKAYELRASASESALDPGEHVKELTR